MRNSSSLDWLRFMHTPNDYRVSRKLSRVNRHQLMYKRKRHPRVEASQMPYSYQVAGPGIEPGTS